MLEMVSHMHTAWFFPGGFEEDRWVLRASGPNLRQRHYEWRSYGFSGQRRVYVGRL